jgi:hypothetical protein
MVERTADGKLRTTEWEDIQYKHGNRVGQYRDKEMVIIAQKLLEGHQDEALRAYDPVAEKVHDKEARGGYEVGPDAAGAERDEADAGSEKDDDDDEDEFLAQYRARRREALEKQVTANKFGRLRKIAGSNYVAEITEASSNKVWVIAALIVEGEEGCDSLLRLFEQVSQRHPAIKFVYLPAAEAIAKFPPKHAPCVLLYYDGRMVHQLTGCDAWGGAKRMSVETVCSTLADYGALPKERDDEPGDDASLQSSKYYAKMSSA